MSELLLLSIILTVLRRSFFADYRLRSAKLEHVQLCTHLYDNCAAEAATGPAEDYRAGQKTAEVDSIHNHMKSRVTNKKAPHLTYWSRYSFAVIPLFCLK